MRRPLSLMMLLFAAGGAAAQVRPGAAAVAPPVTPTVSGIVFDSLTGFALRGATVVVEGQSITASTDSNGRYSIPLDSIGAGTRRFSFFHPAVDTMGIAAPPRTVILEKGVSAVVDLAMPSARTIVGMFCPAGSAERTLIMGDVRDADADKPLAGALVVVMWTQLSIGSSTISKLPQAASVRADSSGFYRLCGVPSQLPLRAQARLSPKQSGWIDLKLESYGVIVQEFLVGDRPVATASSAPLPGTTPAAGGAPTGAAGGAATGAAAAATVALGRSVLAGNVTGPDGAPMEGAQVLLVGTERSVKADYKGNFRMTGLPAGTQKVEVRLLSYQMKSYVVNLSPAREAHLSAVLDRRAQVLDPVVVTSTDESQIPGFDERKKQGQGTFFTHSQIVDGNTGAITDVFRKVPGMKVEFNQGEYIVVANRMNQTCVSAQWYVDGAPFDMANQDPDELVTPTEVEAIEVYNSATTTPMQYQGKLAACGTILIWTVRGKFTPKKKPVAVDTTKRN